MAVTSEVLNTSLLLFTEAQNYVLKGRLMDLGLDNFRKGYVLVWFAVI